MCNKECAICLEPLFTKTDKRILRLKKKVLVKRGERLEITKLKCGHTFHNKCIKNWFVNTDVESSIKCPLCRENIRFKPDSKDLMMHKLRYEDKDYEYGDEYLYEIETESDENEDEVEFTFRFPTRNAMITPVNSDEYDDDDEEYDDDYDEAIEAMNELYRTLVNYESVEL